MTDRERQYRANLKRIEQIKDEIDNLRREKNKLIQQTYYYEHRDERIAQAKARKKKKKLKKNA
jgi:hypothetical protein